MSRILLACPEPLGHRHPAGVGIRFLEFARSMSHEGHAVTVMSPDAGAVEGARSVRLGAQEIASESRSADVAVVQGHLTNDFFAHSNGLPTVVDLYDPYIIENLNYWHSHGDGVFDHDHATLMNSLGRGDLFLCASSAQRLFYAGLLLALRRFDARLYHDDPQLLSLLRIVPFGVPPPATTTGIQKEPKILFGGIYDWYDPILAIDAVAAARQREPRMTLTFTRHPNPDTTPQGRAADAMNYVKTMGFESFVEFVPWAPYEERLAFYERFSAVLLTFPFSLETELAMRTRIFDSLWAGLPVISSTAPGTDTLLEHYDAGIVVRESGVEPYANALLSLTEDPALHARKVAGAARYTAAHQWSRLLEPLLEFCRNPEISATRIERPVELPAPNRSAPSLFDRAIRKMRRLF